jgi:hypothetical protein
VPCRFSRAALHSGQRPSAAAGDSRWAGLPVRHWTTPAAKKLEARSARTPASNVWPPRGQASASGSPSDEWLCGARDAAPQLRAHDHAPERATATGRCAEGRQRPASTDTDTASSHERDGPAIAGAVPARRVPCPGHASKVGDPAACCLRLLARVKSPSTPHSVGRRWQSQTVRVPRGSGLWSADVTPPFAAGASCRRRCPAVLPRTARLRRIGRWTKRPGAGREPSALDC